MEIFRKAVRGLTNTQCKRTRELAIHVAKGPKRGWWKSTDDAVNSFPAKRLRLLKGSANWQAIFAAIQALMEAIMEGKNKT